LAIAEPPPIRISQNLIQVWEKQTKKKRQATNKQKKDRQTNNKRTNEVGMIGVDVVDLH
jgi:hypothetical protein